MSDRPLPLPQQHANMAELPTPPPRPQLHATTESLPALQRQELVGLDGVFDDPSNDEPQLQQEAGIAGHVDPPPRDGRAAHMRTAHNIEDVFLCHECPYSCSDRMQQVRHANDHCASRPKSYKAPCRSTRCEHRSFSTDVLARHHRDDHHASNNSHRAHCPRPEYTYSNDSIVGVSVHILHVHSEAAFAYRKQAAERRRQGEMLAARLASDARRAALRETAARRAASDASSDTVPSSPIETIEGTGDNTPPTTAEPATRKRRLSPEEQEFADVNTMDTLLEAQFAAHKSQTPEELEQFGLNTKQRKKFKVRAAKKAAREGKK